MGATQATSTPTRSVPTQDMRVLIADDNPVNAQFFRMILRGAGYEQIQTTHSAEAVEDLVREWDPDLLVLDLHMPKLTGFQVLGRVREHLLAPQTLPVLVVTADDSSDARRRALSMGARDFVTKPVDPAEVISRVRNLLQSRRLLSDLDQTVAEATHRLQLAHAETLGRLERAAACCRDESTAHRRRVGDLSGRLAQAMGLGFEFVEAMRLAAPLHDIGKLAIPEAILGKAGALDPHERQIMQCHTLAGAEILADSDAPLLSLARDIALCHHERWDGSGYGQGLSGEQIPLGARIVAVAEVYDALTRDRPYRLALDPDSAMSEIISGAGSQFDPAVVEALAELFAPPRGR
jgi:response regulator RpfG family c-di-GMP phosphodiesterase